MRCNTSKGPDLGQCYKRFMTICYVVCTWYATNSPMKHARVITTLDGYGSVNTALKSYVTWKFTAVSKLQP